LGLKSSGNDTGSSLRFQSSYWSRNTLTFDRTIRISSRPGRSPTTQSTRHLTKTIDRVPEVQGLLFAPCTVGPCGLPKTPTFLFAGPRPVPFIRHGQQLSMPQHQLLKASQSPFLWSRNKRKRHREFISLSIIVFSSNSRRVVDLYSQFTLRDPGTERV
jgi:hypothetical protein